LCSQFQDYTQSAFLGGAGDDYIKVKQVWGLNNVDRTTGHGPNKDEPPTFWEPNERGVVSFQAGFEAKAKTLAFQEGFLGTCADLEAAPCDKIGCEKLPDGSKKLLKPNTIDCWIKDFHKYTGAKANDTATWPVGDAFIIKLKAFRINNPGKFEKLIGFKGGKLVYLQLNYQVTCKIFQPNPKTQPVFEEVAKMTETLAAKYPAMGKSIVSGGLFFMWTFTEKALVSNVFQGFAICFPSIFVILTMATHNFIVSLFCLLSGALLIALLTSLLTSLLASLLTFSLFSALTSTLQLAASSPRCWASLTASWAGASASPSPSPPSSSSASPSTTWSTSRTCTWRRAPATWTRAPSAPSRR